MEGFHSVFFLFLFFSVFCFSFHFFIFSHFHFFTFSVFVHFFHFFFCFSFEHETSRMWWDKRGIHSPVLRTHIDAPNVTWYAANSRQLVEGQQWTKLADAVRDRKP